jgi:hypothetical protein
MQQNGQKINVKNNISILRNRSTSPTIIPKKNLVRKGDNNNIVGGGAVAFV